MPPHRRLSWHSVVRLLLMSDLLWTAAALSVAYGLRFHWSSIAGLEPRVPGFPSWMMVPFGVAFLLAFAWAGAYQRENTVSGLDEYGRIFVASGVTVLLAVVIAYLTALPEVSRGFALLSLALVTFGVSVGRFTLRRRIYHDARRGRCLDTAVVVGVNRQAIDVARRLNRNPSASTRVVGFLSDYRAQGSDVVDGLRVLGEPLDLGAVASKVGANRAVVVESGLAWESLRAIVQIMHRRQDLAISLVPGLSDLQSTPMHARKLGSVMMLNPRGARISGAEAVMKRLLDLCLILPALVVAGPLMLVFTVAALVSGNGSGIVSETCEGPGGELLLRHYGQPAWARSAHLSRLPELLLVLTGRISFVGPRPLQLGRVAAVNSSITLLEAAKPGFIGPWWLVGANRPADVQEELAYDVYYLRNYSIWLDVEVLLAALQRLCLPTLSKDLSWPTVEGVAPHVRQPPPVSNR